MSRWRLATLRRRRGQGSAEQRAGEAPLASAYHLYGVVRARGLRGGTDGDALRLRYRDLEALVRPVPFALPALDPEQVRRHQRVVETAMRRGTILPAPYGVVFRGRRPLIRFLEDQYLALDEGLAFLEGQWEMRLHITAAGAQEPTPGLDERAAALFGELRRRARAALPLARTPDRLLSAAFLVPRDSWIDFVERTHELGERDPELLFDVTGPWPPYDFVRMGV